MAALDESLGARPLKDNLHEMAKMNLEKMAGTPARQVPAIGRMVHFTPYTIPDHPSDFPGQKAPATVTGVWEPGNPESDLALTVFLPTHVFQRKQIKYGVDQEGCWMWPAYVAPKRD